VSVLRILRPRRLNPRILKLGKFIVRGFLSVITVNTLLFGAEKSQKNKKGIKKIPLTFSTFQLSLYFFLRSTKYVTASNPATAKIASKPGGVGEGEGVGVGVGVATGETGGVGVGDGVGVGVGETVGDGDGVGDGTAAEISTVIVSVCPSPSSASKV